MGKITGNFRKRMKLGRLLLTYPADNPNKDYTKLSDDEKATRLMHTAYKMLSGGTEFNKVEFAKEWEMYKYMF